MTAWICKDCFEYLLSITGDLECLTDTNIIQEKCLYCKDSVGEYHVVDALPSVSVAMETDRLMTNDKSRT
jgi:hypothetical protein